MMREAGRLLQTGVLGALLLLSVEMLRVSRLDGWFSKRLRNLVLTTTWAVAYFVALNLPYAWARAHRPLLLDWQWVAWLPLLGTVLHLLLGARGFFLGPRP